MGKNVYHLRVARISYSGGMTACSRVFAGII